jgi:tetratricopeptide (TPR) repeat protein
MSNAAKSTPRVEEAKRLTKSGSFKAAEAILMDVVAAEPANAAAWHELGTGYYRSNEFEKAATAFARRLALEPEKPVANYSLALALIKLKRVDDARMQLVRTLKLDPGYTAAKQRLAEIAPAKEPSGEGPQTQAPVGPGGRTRIDEPGKLLIEANPLARCYMGLYLVGALLCLLGLMIGGGAVLLSALGGLVVLVGGEVSRRFTRYRIYEGRIDVARGFLSRITYSVWAYEITEVIFTRSFLQVMIGTATIWLKVENRQPVRIAGIASVKKMKELFEKLRNIVLAERWGVKKQWV